MPRKAKKQEESEEKTTKKSSTQKECLIDLVNESEIPLWKMMMDLSRMGWDKQLEEETRLRRLGEPIEPTITKSEFDKEILGA